MSIYEYDEEKHMRQEREQNWEDGHTEGYVEALIETCQDLSVSREETAERICKKFSISEEEAEKNLEKYWK